MNEIKRIGVLTSGGDACGMNAVIRSVTRYAIYKGLEVVGFYEGYKGLIENNFKVLDLNSVGGIIDRGGTFLYSARSEEFKTKEGQKKAIGNLKSDEVDGLIVIGGDGTFKGAHDLNSQGVRVVGIPATIDNDIPGTDYSIGFDTALNVIIDIMSKIRDTASSHDRIFVIEVMGRNSGMIAVNSGVACGADYVLIPEIEVDMEKICERIVENSKKGKRSNIIVAAEGVNITRKLARIIEKKTKCEVRITVLGHVQRGGHPTARSRMLACLFGEKAVNMLLEGERNKITAIQNGKITTADLKESFTKEKPLNLKLLKLAEELSI